MKIPNAVHVSRPWRIHQIASEFRLEDVWALPAVGGPNDFRRLVAMISSYDPTKSRSIPVRSLFALRWRLGALLHWDDSRDAVGSGVSSLRTRMPADLLDHPTCLDSGPLPFDTLYFTNDEWAAEIANRTVHGIVHVGWAPAGDGRFRAEMAVYVKPNGVLGTAYLAAIRPFRYLIVYPAMLREIGRQWAGLADQPLPSSH